MKKIVYSISIALAALCAVSCSEGGEQEGYTGETTPNGEIAFTRIGINSNVDDEITTDNIESFGIFVEPYFYNVNNISTRYVYKNVKVEDINGEWCSSQMLFWDNLTSATYFAAYSPYNANLAINTIDGLNTAMDSIYDNGFIKSDQSTLANYTASDLLLANGWVIPDVNETFNSGDDFTFTSNGFVQTSFSHQCAMVVFEIMLSPEFYTLDAGYPKATLIEGLQGGDRTTQSYVTVGNADANMCRKITIKTIIEPRLTLLGESLKLQVQTSATSTSTWESTTIPDYFSAGKVYTVDGLNLGDEIMTGGTGFTVGGWDSMPDTDITTDFPTL